jgi:hypothetical protein
MIIVVSKTLGWTMIRAGVSATGPGIESALATVTEGLAKATVIVISVIMIGKEIGSITMWGGLSVLLVLKRVDLCRPLTHLRNCPNTHPVMKIRTIQALRNQMRLPLLHRHLCPLHLGVISMMLGRRPPPSIELL